MSLDRDPGFYEAEGGATQALIEQQRAWVRDGLRTAPAASVTWMDTDGGLTHWAFAPEGTVDDPGAFLVYVVCRAWRDAAAALDVANGTLLGIVIEALARGVGSA